jgi:hypothetical protein
MPLLMQQVATELSQQVSFVAPSLFILISMLVLFPCATGIFNGAIYSCSARTHELTGDGASGLTAHVPCQQGGSKS